MQGGYPERLRDRCEIRQPAGRLAVADSEKAVAVLYAFDAEE
jgi:hypothetical protein